MEKFELLEKEDIVETPRKERIPASWPTLIYKLSIMSVLRNISTGQLGLAIWLCLLPSPAHLLIS